MSDHSAMDHCLFLLHFSRLTKVEKLKLEVQIRPAKQAASSSGITHQKKETLLATVRNEIISLYNNPTSSKEFTSLISFLSSVPRECGSSAKEQLATRQLMRWTAICSA